LGTNPLTARYSGGSADTVHFGSTSTALITVAMRPTTTTVVCSPAVDPVNAPSTCTATVADVAPGTTSTPSGEVSWTVAEGTGKLSTASCTLDRGGSCAVGFTATPGAEGNVLIVAGYGGGHADRRHAPSWGGDAFVAGQRSTSTLVSCNPPSVTGGASALCTATVSDASAGTPLSVSGDVIWAVNGDGGTLSVSRCTLSSSGSCSVSYRAGSARTTVTIVADYNGGSVDVDHAPSGGQTTESVT
ncbi:MAG: hypothetical protein JOY80_11705, partial [Candidatus Dormibacteraeota bacterium]|nr:hypothetical protein [Candidatus Dormibacteraeota bacterium]